MACCGTAEGEDGKSCKKLGLLSIIIRLEVLHPFREKVDKALHLLSEHVYSLYI